MNNDRCVGGCIKAGDSPVAGFVHVVRRVEMSEQSMNPWNVSEADYPAKANPADRLRILQNDAVLAPSGHSSPP